MTASSLGFTSDDGALRLINDRAKRNQETPERNNGCLKITRKAPRRQANAVALLTDLKRARASREPSDVNGRVCRFDGQSPWPPGSLTHTRHLGPTTYGRFLGQLALRRIALTVPGVVRDPGHPKCSSFWSVRHLLIPGGWPLVASGSESPHRLVSSFATSIART